MARLDHVNMERTIRRLRITLGAVSLLLAGCVLWLIVLSFELSSHESSSGVSAEVDDAGNIRFRNVRLNDVMVHALVTLPGTDGRLRALLARPIYVESHRDGARISSTDLRWMDTIDKPSPPPKKGTRFAVVFAELHGFSR